MLAKQQVIDILRAEISTEDELVLGKESESAWLFHTVDKKYLKTRDPQYIPLGSSKGLIQKADGKVHWFNWRWTDEESLKICDLGYFKYDHWDLEITRVLDESLALKYLSQLELESVVREGAHGVFVTTRTRLSSERLAQILKNAPVRFFLGDARMKWKILETFKSQAAFTYQLSEHDWGTKCV